MVVGLVVVGVLGLVVLVGCGDVCEYEVFVVMLVFMLVLEYLVDMDIDLFVEKI